MTYLNVIASLKSMPKQWLMQTLKVRYFVLYLKMGMTIVGDLRLTLKAGLLYNPLGYGIEMNFVEMAIWYLAERM